MANPFDAFDETAAAAPPAASANPFDAFDAPPDTTRKIARMVGQAAQGTNDSLVADLFGAPVDLVSKGLRKIGVPIQANPIGGSESIKKGIDYVATLPSRIHNYTDILNPTPDNFTDNRTSRFEPATKGEKIGRASCRERVCHNV